ncbi:hypothetical protein [Cellulomonas fengjieae]|uniref:hypothetical protein n=1 Tax=Cellulomonas fengjieae TaxID=2819978 RepID=UPI001FBA23A8|nr:hypothetical protein [Cellulomonas fengjieae]
MSDDLHALLARAAEQIEGAAPALEGGRLGVVRSAARRRRVVRRATESFAAVGVVGALGAGLWFGLGQSAPDPVVPVETQTVTPTPTPEPSATPTPTPTPTGPPTRADSIDDATVVARLSAPRTGEVWTTPVRAPEQDALLPSDDFPGWTVYLVGSRADASIYLGVSPWSGPQYGPGAEALFEVDASGARLIACPSARTGDPCVDPDGAVPIARDEATFYDTLTLPESVDLGGFVVTTAGAREQASPHFLGRAVQLEGPPFEIRTVRTLGSLAVVERSEPSEISGLTNLSYGVLTPFGSFVQLFPGDVPGGDFGDITWDDGVTRGEVDEWTSGPGSGSCSWWAYSREQHHAAEQWREGGTTADGRRVWIPAAGGNPLSRTVRAWHEARAQAAGEEYPYPTDDAFLQANALFAIQGPGGEWLVGGRGDALSWACA